MIIWSVGFNLAYKDGSKLMFEVSKEEKGVTLRNDDAAAWATCVKLPKFVDFLTTLGIGGVAEMPADLLDYTFRFTGTTANGYIHVIGGSDTLRNQVICNGDPVAIATEFYDDPTFATYFARRYAVLINTDYVDYDPGNPSAEASNLVEMLSGFGLTVSTFTDVTSSGFAAALQGTKAIIIPEQEEDDLNLFPSAAETVKNWVDAGGILFAFYGGSVGAADDFINETFDLSITALGEGSGPYTKTADAVGTSLSAGPSSLNENNATGSIDKNSLPPESKSFYDNAGQTVVAEIPYGSGKIYYIGYDWYDYEGDGQDPNWISVIRLLTTSTT